MPRGRPRKQKLDTLPEGWGRCADCVAKNYETWCNLLNRATTERKRVAFEIIMMANEEVFNTYCKRNKAGTKYDPKEHTCTCCTYEREYKGDVESGKSPTVTNKMDFKRLCKEYMKTYKKVERIPITSRKTKVKIKMPPKVNEDEV